MGNLVNVLIFNGVVAKMSTTCYVFDVWSSFSAAKLAMALSNSMIAQITSITFQRDLPRDIFTRGLMSKAELSQKTRRPLFPLSFSLKASQRKPTMPKNRTSW